MSRGILATHICPYTEEDKTMEPQNYMSADAIAAEQQRFMVRVYNWMAGGLALTGLMAFYVANSQTMLNLIYSNSAVVWILFAVEIGLVIYLSGWIEKCLPARQPEYSCCIQVSTA